MMKSKHKNSIMTAKMPTGSSQLVFSETSDGIEPVYKILEDITKQRTREYKLKILLDSE